MNDLHAKALRKPIETAVLDIMLNFVGSLSGEFLVGKRSLGNIEQRLFRKVRNQSGIRAMFDDRRGTGFGPARDHLADLHVPPIKGSLGRMLVFAAFVWVPEFDGGVDVHHAFVVAPLEDFAAVDVPGEIDQHIAGDRCLPSSVPIFSRPTRSRTKIHALRCPLPEAFERSSKSITVIFFIGCEDA